MLRHGTTNDLAGTGTPSVHASPLLGEREGTGTLSLQALYVPRTCFSLPYDAIPTLIPNVSEDEMRDGDEMSRMLTEDVPCTESKIYGLKDLSPLHKLVHKVVLVRLK